MTRTQLEPVYTGLRALGLQGDWVSPGDLDRLGPLKGAYVLVIRLDAPLPHKKARAGCHH